MKLPTSKTFKVILPVILLMTMMMTCFTYSANAQYFGQNKVRYKNLKFKVYETPHFELYYYTKNDSLIKAFAKESEAWYSMHQQVFKDTFRVKNPIILYGNSPEFQQTTVIGGEIGVGTGGVTEGLKNRVIMPLQEINGQTRHVLGHELVHAFQYHSLIEGDSTQLENIGNLPLWMIEGMAEYLSLGKVDANTAMWMRDAVLNKDIPSLEDLTTNSKYFPYRYGQAFWAFIGSTYGDSTIFPFFKSTAKYGYQSAIRRTFGYDDKTLSTLWKSALNNTYKPYLKDGMDKPIGVSVADTVSAGEMNVAPAISPDGKYLAYLSEKDIFSIDLYLADAKTGKAIRKLTSKITNSHIDEFNFIESAGAWSPDSKKFAFSVFGQGRNNLIIVDVSNGRTLLDKSMGDVEQFGNLTWSSDGVSIAFSGLKDGQSDLFSYNTESKNVTQITNDRFTDYQPSYSKDGKKIIFSTDRMSAVSDDIKSSVPMGMAILDLETQKITNIDVFPGANNFNPLFADDDSQIYFLSNRDGFRNLYRHNLTSLKTEQLTDYFTGISGITENSPALSISNNNDIVYSYYRSQRYTLYNAKSTDFTPTLVGNNSVNLAAATLPPATSVGVDIVNKNLENFFAYDDLPTDSVKSIPFKSQFKLDYIANNGAGVSTSRFGTGLSGGVQAIFSDILSRNQIFAAASVNGEIYDAGAQIAYVNQESRWGWGGAISHIPYQFGTYGAKIEPRTVNGNSVPTYTQYTDLIRVFEESAQGFTSYPFNKITRVEFGAGASKYSYRVDRYSRHYLYYPATGTDRAFIGGYYDQDKERVSLDDFNKSSQNSLYGTYNLAPYTIFQLNTALVGDNSFSGVASPLSGYRYRIGIEQYFGTFNYTAPTIDFRKYLRVKPITFAGRIYGYGRLGDTNNQLYPIFIGYPYLIRGYEANSFYGDNGSQSVSSNGFGIDQLIGNRIAVANFEVRLPFTGPEKLSLIPSKFLFSELNLFFDAGLAWDKGQTVDFGRKGPPQIGVTADKVPLPVYNNNVKVPAYSAGISARVNIFGYFVLEPYMAFPFNRKDVKKPVFGLAFSPGW